MILTTLDGPVAHFKLPPDHVIADWKAKIAAVQDSVFADYEPEVIYAGHVLSLKRCTTCKRQNAKCDGRLCTLYTTHSYDCIVEVDDDVSLHWFPETHNKHDKFIPDA